MTKSLRRVCLAMLALGVAAAHGLLAQEPERLPRERVDAIIRSLPERVPFGFTGLAFHDGRLFATSNIGVFVLEDRRMRALYRWGEEHEHTSNPWRDPANDALWLQHETRSELLRLDDEGWHAVPWPKKRKGYYSRADALSGFAGVSHPDGFWLLGGGELWRWEAERSRWTSEEIPDSKGGIVAFAPLPSGPVCIMRNQLAIGDVVTSGEPDTVHASSDDGWEVLDSPKRRFFAEGLVALDKSAFVRTNQGRLFEVTSSGVVRVSAPGVCEVMARSTTGRLLASFPGEGIFVREGDDWRRLYPSPLPAEEEHFVFLAGSENLVAYATSSTPELKPRDPEDKRGDEPLEWEDVGTTGLWIGQGKRLVPVFLDGAWRDAERDRGK